MDRPVPVPSGTVRLADARKLYVARTYMYVAAKQARPVIVDVTRPTAPIPGPPVTSGGAKTDHEAWNVGANHPSARAYLASEPGGSRRNGRQTAREKRCQIKKG